MTTWADIRAAARLLLQFGFAFVAPFAILGFFEFGDIPLWLALIGVLASGGIAAALNATANY